MNESVKLRGLSRSFIDGKLTHEVLRNVDLTVPSGQTVAVVGPSGVGKSTLLNLIGTLDIPTAGSIIIDGNDVMSLKSAARARFRNRRIGFIFQFHHLLPEFTVLENLLMPVRWGGGDLAGAEKEARLWLDRVGLGARAESQVTVLSGGEAQRVAALRAVIHHPSVLLADEPTGNLDGDNAQKLIDFLMELVTETGMTMLMATHNLDFANRCQRIVQLGNAQIVSDHLLTDKVP